MFKQMVFDLIRNELMKLDDEWVHRWIRCEVTVLQNLIQSRENDLRLVKGVALQTVSSITVHELQSVCSEAKPHLREIWYSSEAREKMETELRNIRGYISGL